MRVELLRHTVEEADSGTKLSHVLRVRLGLSQRLYRRLKRENGIQLNGAPAMVSAVVKAGDLIVLSTDPEGNGDTVVERVPLSIVYEDSALLVVDKPPGICVHPTNGHWTGTLANGVAHHFATTGVQARVRPVHRLDMDTSGLVMFAKTQLAHQRLAEQLEDRRMGRTYLAVVAGVPSPGEGRLEGAIARRPDCPKGRSVRAGGKKAATWYKVLADYKSAALLQLRLETGRTHQIRVHLAHIGHPLVGDPMYQPKTQDAQPIAFGRQALHAHALEFVHPQSGVPMRLVAELPGDMAKLVESLSGLSGCP